jgi:hypothetical protein
MLAAVGLMGTPPPCEAAFGQAANIFGKPTNTAGTGLSAGTCTVPRSLIADEKTTPS